MSGSQWKTLSPQINEFNGGFGSGNGSGGGPNQRPRQITKNPNVMSAFQAFPVNGGGGSGIGGFGLMPSGGGGPVSPGAGNGRLLSSASSGQLGSLLSAVGNGNSYRGDSQMHHRMSPNSFIGGAFPRGSSSMSSAGSGMTPSRSTSNGYDGRPHHAASNGFGNGGYEGRSGLNGNVSGFFESFKQPDTMMRQLSMPSYLGETGLHRMSGGGGQRISNGYNNVGRQHDSNNGFGLYLGMRPSEMGSSSPPCLLSPGGLGGLSDMKIGTWEGTSSSSAQSSSGQGSRSMMGPLNNGHGNGSSSTANNGFPPVGDFEIGTFTMGSKDGEQNAGYGGSRSSNNQPPGPGTRETGIIEKLLVNSSF